MKLLLPDLLCVCSIGANIHVLRDGDKLYLIDGGFIGGVTLLQRALKKVGWSGLRIEGVLVTHGHLDHVLNLHELRQTYGLWIAVPKLDKLHYQQQYYYSGSARICGWLEKLGRRILGYKSAAVDYWLEVGEILPIWGGLKVLHLPGHTVGHCGYYAESRGILFSGDLFASYGIFSHLPPRFLNDDHIQSRKNLEKLNGIKLRHVYPNHGYCESGEIHLKRLNKIKKSINRKKEKMT